MITNGKNGRVKRENSLLRLGGGMPLFDALTLFDGGYSGKLVEASPEHMYSDAGSTLAGIGEAVHSIREQVGGGLVSQTTLADRGLRGITGVMLDGVSDKYPTGWIPPAGAFTMLIAYDVAGEPVQANSMLFGGVRGGTNRMSLVVTKTTGVTAMQLGGVAHTMPGDPRAAPLNFAMARNPAGTDIKLYKDGELIVTDTATAIITVNQVMIGTRDGTISAADWATGTFRAFMAINRELSEAEIDSVFGRWDQLRARDDSLPVPPASVVMHYGQSNALGIETTAQSIYAKHGNRCFAVALESWVADNDASGGSDRTQSQLLRERTYESGMTHGLGRLVDRKMAAAGTINWKALAKHYFAINPAVSGVNIDTLTDSSAWTRAELDIAGAKTLTGDTGTFDWLWWVQGYSDAAAARGVYAPKLVTLIDKIRAEAISAGFAGANPRTVIGQMCQSRQAAGFPSVSLGQLAVADADALVDIFPLYQVQWLNGVHMNALGQRIKGEYFAKTMMDIEAGTYAPVRWSVTSWTDTEIVLNVSGGTGVYSFDTTNIPAVTNMGFDVWASDDTTLQNIISGVSLVGSTITISLSSPAPAGARLGYGWGRAGMAMPVNAPYALGNLRDNDARTALVSGVSYPLYNWCLIMDAIKP